MNDGGMNILRDQNWHVAGRGHESHQNVILALGTGHEDGCDLVAGFVHCFDDLVGLEGDELHRGIVVQSKAIDALIAAEPDDRPGHAGIRDWRPISKKVSIEEEMTSKVGDGWRLGLGLHILEMLVEIVINISIVRLRYAQGLLKGRMGLENMLEKLAGCTLASFGHPVLRNQHISIRPPHPRDKHRLGGHGNVAGGRPCNGCQTSERLSPVILGNFRAELPSAQFHLRSNGPNPTGVGIDHTATYRDSSR